MSETMTKPDTLGLTRKYFSADEVNFTPGERSFVAWVSTEVVDHEGDLVVASGVDFKSVYLKNPVVMAFHDYGAWPVGQCEWLKVRKSAEWTGLYAKAVVDGTPDTDVVWEKIQRRTVRGVSIGFRKPEDYRPGEWGPPTADELKRHPHWKGARQIVRRCLMIEFSVCPIGMNQTALIEAVSKGVHKPAYQATEQTVPEANETPEAETPEAAAATPYGLPPVPIEIVVPPDDAPATKALPAPEDDEDAEAEDEGPVRNGHFVRVVKGPYKGVVGKVKSVHRGGPVPDVEDDVMGTKGDPAARVCCYKAMGDGHAETAHHVGVKVAHVERTDDLKPPRKKKAAEPAPLPPLSGKTDGQIAAERLREVRKALRPEAVAAMVRAEEDRAMGAV